MTGFLDTYKTLGRYFHFEKRPELNLCKMSDQMTDQYKISPPGQCSYLLEDTIRHTQGME
jgi:hypothetical protein